MDGPPRGGGGGMDDVQMMLLSLCSSNEESNGNGLDLSPVIHSAIKKEQRCLEGCSMYH